MIIVLHTRVLELLPDKYYIQNLFVRLGVPYFFVASGYYLRKKYICSNQNQYKNVLLSYEKRLLYPFVFFLIIALRQSWTTYMLEGATRNQMIKLLAQDAFCYQKGALWFVMSLLIAALISYPFMKMKNGVNICLAIGGFLFIFALICNNYYFVVENTPLQTVVDKYMSIFISARNGLFVGLLFLSLGMKCFDIRNSSEKIRNNRKICLFAFILFFAVYVAEVAVLRYIGGKRIDDRSLYICQIFLVPALFLVSVLYPVNIPVKLSILLRNLSTGMYYLHRPILWWVLFVSDNFIVTFAVVTLTAFAVCMISYKVKFKNKYYLLK